MSAVSNTSPLCYLCLVDALHLLPVLFGTVVIPAAVLEEPSHSSAPSKVRELADSFPDWLKVDRREFEQAVDPRFRRLHKGERDAIHVALSRRYDIILLDEIAARRAAEEAGLGVTGVLGILVEGASRNLIDLPEAIARLRTTTFRVSPVLLQRVLHRFSRR